MALSRLPGFWFIMAVLAGLIALAAINATRRTIVIDDVRGGPPPGAATTWPDMRIDINRASAAELALLPGVGETLAQRIIEYRAANGPFNTVEELSRVERIGDAVLSQLTPYVVALPPDDSAAQSRPDPAGQ